ncbi:MAG: galactokinase [Lentisphaerae bacterium]|nr:galactokinase [Lentisphaerota bacterium]
MMATSRNARMRETFETRYGRAPAVWVRAPGRVDLMGSHTDYNEGCVLTMAIDRDTRIAAAPRDDRRVQVYAMDVGAGAAFDLDTIAHDPDTPWCEYVRGVAAVLQEAGYALTGCDAVIQSTVPIGSGLSSSAALECAAAVLFRELGGWTVDPVRLALLCQKSETAFVGMNCGVLDQYSSIMGEAGCVLLLDCRALTSRPAPLADGIHAVICDTRAERKLTGSEYGERRGQCEEGVRLLKRAYPDITALRDVTLEQFDAGAGALPDVVAKRCRFVIEENDRVTRLAEALSAGDRKRIRALMDGSYAGARDLYEIVSPEMAALEDAMLNAPGVIGARQAGAGFGGCMVALVEADRLEAFAPHVREAYQAAVSIDPHVYPVAAAAGAGLLPEGPEAVLPGD